MASEDRWQLHCAELKQRGAYLFHSKIWSDCTFQLDDVTVKAHRLIMAMASPVFSKMLYGSFVKFPMYIDDVRPEVFNLLLEYIYSDNLSIHSSKDACDLYYAAKKWRLPHVSKCCVKYLLNNMSPNNVCNIYKVACESDDQELQLTCEKIFSSRTKEVLKDESFFDIDVSTVKRLFTLEPLNINSELDLFEALVAYAKFHDGDTENVLRRTCGELDGDENMEESSNNAANQSHDSNHSAYELSPSKNDTDLKKKQKYRDLVHNIRFLTLTPQEFAECTSLSSLLTDAEVLSLAMNISSKESAYPLPAGFSTNMVPRTQATHEDRSRLAAVFKSIINNFRNINKYESMPFYLRNLAWTLMVIRTATPSTCKNSKECFALVATCFFDDGAPEWVKKTKVKVKFITHKPVPKHLHKIALRKNELTPEYGAWVSTVQLEDLLNPDYGFVDDFNTVTYKLYVNTVPRPSDSPDSEEIADPNSMDYTPHLNFRLPRPKKLSVTSDQAAENTSVSSKTSEKSQVQNKPTLSPQPKMSPNVTQALKSSAPNVAQISAHKINSKPESNLIKSTKSVSTVIQSSSTPVTTQSVFYPANPVVTTVPQFKPTPAVTNANNMTQNVTPPIQLRPSTTVTPPIQPRPSPILTPPNQPRPSSIKTPTTTPLARPSPTVTPPTLPQPTPTLNPPIQPRPSPVTLSRLYPAASPATLPPSSPILETKPRPSTTLNHPKQPRPSTTLTPPTQPRPSPALTPPTQPRASPTLSPTTQPSPSPTLATTSQLQKNQIMATPTQPPYVPHALQLSQSMPNHILLSSVPMDAIRRLARYGMTPHTIARLTQMGLSSNAICAFSEYGLTPCSVKLLTEMQIISPDNIASLNRTKLPSSQIEEMCQSGIPTLELKRRLLQTGLSYDEILPFLFKSGRGREGSNAMPQSHDIAKTIDRKMFRIDAPIEDSLVSRPPQKNEPNLPKREDSDKSLHESRCSKNQPATGMEIPLTQSNIAKAHDSITKGTSGSSVGEDTSITFSPVSSPPKLSQSPTTATTKPGLEQSSSNTTVFSITAKSTTDVRKSESSTAATVLTFDTSSTTIAFNSIIVDPPSTIPLNEEELYFSQDTITISNPSIPKPTKRTSNPLHAMAVSWPKKRTRTVSEHDIVSMCQLVLESQTEAQMSDIKTSKPINIDSVTVDPPLVVPLNEEEFGLSQDIITISNPTATKPTKRTSNPLHAVMLPWPPKRARTVSSYPIIDEMGMKEINRKVKEVFQPKCLKAIAFAELNNLTQIVESKVVKNDDITLVQPLKYLALKIIMDSTKGDEKMTTGPKSLKDIASSELRIVGTKN
ncbi:hypothetical protein O0L34_g9193 [Tuta absoluta]|nr:hypothetical protein O0L34_g9193 [Tuta absoluta]